MACIRTWETLAGLTPKSTFSIRGVQLEQGLGRIDASLEVLNVVQDMQQNFLLSPKERQGHIHEWRPETTVGCRRPEAERLQNSVPCPNNPSIDKHVPILLFSPHGGPMR